MNKGFNELTELVAHMAEQMLAQGDDRITILGMIQSAVTHGLTDAGFTDDTE